MCGENHLTNLDISHLITSLLDLGINHMPTLNEVCTWRIPFPPEWIQVDTTGSPNICFETDCNGTCDETGFEENTITGYSIFPNPTNYTLTIKTEKPDHRSIEIASINGQLLFTAEMKETSQQIDVSSFQKGVYFIIIRSKEFVVIRKIIKL